MKYRSSDVCSFGQANKFRDCFGNVSWETMAGSIIVISQSKGQWTPLPYDNGYDPQGMIAAGFLENVDEKYMLTDAAIEKINERYPKT